MRQRMGGMLILTVLIVMAACGASETVPPAAITAAGVQVAARPNWMQMPPDQLTKIADQYIAHMTLNQKIGQMLMMEFINTGYNGDSITMIKTLQPGGLILYKYQMPDVPTIQDMTQGAQHDSKIPMFVALDQEGGFIDNLSNIYAPRGPSATEIGQSNDPQLAYQQGQITAQHMLPLGFNTDLAPVADVEIVHGPDQATRTFGTTADQVTKMLGPWLNGLQEHGVIGTMKHFPGLGGASCDAHTCLPVINRTVDQLNQVEFAPYKAMLASADPPGIIMSTDLLMPALDFALPAELSPAIITGVLRNQLGYDGVVITDALYMKGINAERFPPPQAAVQAVVAGCDLLLGAASTDEGLKWLNAIKAAIQAGTLTEQRINKSVERILMLKLRRGLLAPNPPSN